MMLWPNGPLLVIRPTFVINCRVFSSPHAKSMHATSDVSITSFSYLPCGLFSDHFCHKFFKFLVSFLFSCRQDHFCIRPCRITDPWLYLCCSTENLICNNYWLRCIFYHRTYCLMESFHHFFVGRVLRLCSFCNWT